MKTQLYAIYDKVAERTGPIYEAVNNNVALRNYANFLTSGKLDSSDFELYTLGFYDTEKIVLKSIKAKLVQITVNTEENKNE